MLIAAALTIAPPTAADAAWPGPGFCADVRLALSAARASPPFSSLPPRTFVQGSALFGFAWPCRIEPSGRALLCSQYVMRDREAETLAEATARCLPGARRDPDDSSEGRIQSDRPTFPYFRARFHLPDITIEIDRGGNPANHLGQFISYRVTLNARR